MFTLDKNYRYISFSKKYKEIIKKALDVDIQVGDCMVDSIMDESDKNRIKHHFEKVLKGDSFTLSEEFINKKLHSTHWESHYTPLYKDEEIIGINMIIYELTHYVNTSRNFNEIKIFEQLVNLIDVGVALVDPHQEDIPIIYVNKSFSNITGYKKDELIGKNGCFLHKHNLDQEELKILQESVTNKKGCEVIIRANKKDGTLFIAFLNITPILDTNKKVIYLAGIFIDITNTVEVKRLEIIKELSSGLTHELNTALTLMNGHIEMLGYDINALDNQIIKKDMNYYLNEIQESQKVILGISNSLHYLNNLPVKTQKQTNIMTTLLKTIEEFKLKIEQNEIQVNINSKDILESENIEIFYTIEEKVLIYLWSVFIDNCIDSLLMKEDLRTINIYIYERKEKIHIAIRDNGIGIPTDIQDELFQPLIKGKKFGGIGMGLFNAKNIIETYNGTISFYSNNELTIFDVTFKKY
jgi:PAS domain S-box-containing protein